MSKNAKLIGFIPVIPDVCTFVQPVFLIDDHMALQQVGNDKILSWSLFDVDDSIIIIPAEENLILSIGSDAVFGFQPLKDQVWFGKSKMLACKLSQEWVDCAASQDFDIETITAVKEFICSSFPKDDDLVCAVSGVVSMYQRNYDGSWRSLIIDGSQSEDVSVLYDVSVYFKKEPLFNTKSEPTFNQANRVARSVKFVVLNNETEESIFNKFAAFAGRVESVSLNLAGNGRSGRSTKLLNRIGGPRLFSPISHKSPKMQNCIVVMQSIESMRAARKLAAKLDIGKRLDNEGRLLLASKTNSSGLVKRFGFGNAVAPKKSRIISD